MGYLGRRIGLSQDNGDSNPGAAGGAVGGGILDLFSNGYFERQGDIFNVPGAPPSALTATGGIISDYTSGSDVYRAHVFTSSGTFDVTALSNNIDNGDNIDYLVVAGGGGGGANLGGGGGAGGLRTSMPEGPGGGGSAEAQLSGTVATYPVVIGAGANAQEATQPGVVGTQGNSTIFTHPGGTITSTGGGGGGAGASNSAGSTPGGSGGGAGGYPGGYQGGTATGDTYPGDPADTSPANGWGYDGGDSCLLYTSPSPRDRTRSRMPSSA